MSKMTRVCADIHHDIGHTVAMVTEEGSRQDTGDALLEFVVGPKIVIYYDRRPTIRTTSALGRITGRTIELRRKRQAALQGVVELAQGCRRRDGQLIIEF